MAANPERGQSLLWGRMCKQRCEQCPRKARHPLLQIHTHTTLTTGQQGEQCRSRENRWSHVCRKMSGPALSADHQMGGVAPVPTQSISRFSSSSVDPGKATLNMVVRETALVS